MNSLLDAHAANPALPTTTTERRKNQPRRPVRRTLQQPRQLRPVPASVSVETQRAGQVVKSLAPPATTKKVFSPMQSQDNKSLPNVASADKETGDAFTPVTREQVGPLADVDSAEARKVAGVWLARAAELNAPALPPTVAPVVRDVEYNSKRWAVSAVVLPTHNTKGQPLPPSAFHLVGLDALLLFVRKGFEEADTKGLLEAAGRGTRNGPLFDVFQSGCFGRMIAVGKMEN